MGNELTDLLIHALDNSQAGFDVFKQSFNECSSSFEVGDDQKGMQIIQGLIAPLGDFSNFCADMIQTHADIIDEEHMKVLTEQCQTLENLFAEIVKEMEDHNFVEVGDILKYDFGDLINQMAKTFPEIASSLKDKQPSGKS